MPRATRSSTKSSTVPRRSNPYSKPSSNSATSSVEQTTPTSRQNISTAKPNKGKASHLYTDDNPSTTLKGTSFKSKPAAEHTIALVSKRSLLYQFQTINTMYHRALHHPAYKSSPGMQDATQVFREWLDKTYPDAKARQRAYPVLRRDVVERCLPEIRRRGVEGEWAETFVGVAKGKRLANVLMDEARPEQRDLAVVRQGALDEIVDGECGGRIPVKGDQALWGGKECGVSDLHLKLITYGFSPVTPDKLLVVLGDGKR